MTDRLTNLALAAIGRRVTRRRFLQRFATAGSALAVAPLRFALRPLSAMSVITCSSCTGGQKCCDGWTEFCCTIKSGNNACPSYSFMAGWWKCTSYTGSKLCSDTGVRYIIDCNRTPTWTCPDGCHCAQDDCNNRSTCCNWFRYGQCNVEVKGVTEVVCRMVTCENPCSIFVNCNCSQFIDNNTCTHEAACL